MPRERKPILGERVLSDKDSTCAAAQSQTVEYRDIPRFPGYRVGSDGSVWTSWTLGRGSHPTDRWRRLRPAIGKSKRFPRRVEYPRVTLRGEGHAPRTITIHTLVLEAFIGSRPDGMEGCHIDGNVWNMCVTNLRWDSKKSNASDKHKHGTMFRPLGEKNGHATFTQELVKEIRSSYERGMKAAEIARSLSLRPQSVVKIIAGTRWAHLPWDRQEAIRRHMENRKGDKC